MTMKQFAQFLEISLSSLVEYEAGRRLPRIDTIEQIAEKLHRTPASLFSDPASAGRAECAPLDGVAIKIQSLHPDVRATARHALDLLRLAFRESDEIFFLETRAAPAKTSGGCFRYCLHESRCPLFAPPAYGILVEKLLDGSWTACAVFAPFSADRLFVLNIVLTANKLQLPPEQFLSDVFCEFFPHPQPRS